MYRAHGRYSQGAGAGARSAIARRVRVGAGVASLAMLASLAFGGPGAHAAAPIDLGAADPFAVLGATTVTSAGVSTVKGDLGVSPGTSVTGFGPGIGTVTEGSIHANDSVAAQAHADLATAYAVAVARTPDKPAVGALDGKTLFPGVHASGSTLTLAGTLTLDALGDPNAVFILQAGSTLGTAAGSQVSLTGGAQACNVFWQVGSSATLGASSLLRGSILAHTSITVGAGVTIHGRALARDGAVTLDNDTISVSRCAAGALTNTAPAITPFEATLTGVTRTVHAAVGAWSVIDTRGSGAGYLVTVKATAPTVGGSVAAAGTGAGLTLTPRAAVAAPGNAASPGPGPAGAQQLGANAATIAGVAAGGGQGEWVFPADAGAEKSLGIVIPADASAGTFSSTLTFTTAPPAA